MTIGFNSRLNDSRPIPTYFALCITPTPAKLKRQTTKDAGIQTFASTAAIMRAMKRARRCHSRLDVELIGNSPITCG